MFMKNFLLRACTGIFALDRETQDAEVKHFGGRASGGMQRKPVAQKLSRNAIAG
jgi:hypothetical protein